MAYVNLYDSVIKFPSQGEKSNNMAYLAYITRNAGSIIEYAGRTCYRSFNNIKTDSYKTFISGIVKSGHESVIEHSNLVYVVLKTQNKDIKVDSNNINRYLINVMMYNGLLRVSENQAFYTISGNLRMFKDLIREYVKIKALNNKNNPILEDIMNSFYTLPEYFFIDMINSGTLDKDKFKPNPRIVDSSNATNSRVLNEYVTVINIDNFSFKVKGFIANKGGESSAHRISIPPNVLKRHNRMTLVINAPRYITHQLVRHRLASYSQASQRYCLEGGLNVYVPEAIKENPAANATANMLFNNALQSYASLIDMGIKKEDARSVLTNAQMSTVVMTATLEEFDHFVDVRADKAAQNFIRDMIAVPIKNFLEKYYAEQLRHNGENSAVSAERKEKYQRKQQNKVRTGNKNYRNSGNKKQSQPNKGNNKPGNKKPNKPGNKPNQGNKKFTKRPNKPNKQQ